MKTSLRGARGTPLLAGVKTFENTRSVAFSSGFEIVLFGGAFSERGLVEGAVSLTVRTERGVKGAIFCCPGSTKDVN